MRDGRKANGVYRHEEQAVTPELLAAGSGPLPWEQCRKGF